MRGRIWMTLGLGLAAGCAAGLEYDADGACALGAFDCGDGSCIADSLRCDGVNNCYFGNDEKDCGPSPMADDGADDSPPVPDGPEPCPSLTCPDGTCVDQTEVCDDVQHCASGWDEQDCGVDGECGANEWACPDGTCIDDVYLCDGESNCAGGEDEAPAFCEGDGGACPEADYVCEGTGACMPAAVVCNGVADCPAEDDERDCDGMGCSPGELTCPDGACVSQAQVCDGVSNCADGSDEQGCAANPMGACAKSETACPLTGKCIATSAHCDGTLDCAFGLDEAFCGSGGADETFQCLDGTSIPIEWVCDGEFVDCEGGEDEIDC